MNRSGKVIHISDKAHRKLQKFCRKTGIPLAQWVEEALLICMEAYRGIRRKKR